MSVTVLEDNILRALKDAVKNCNRNLYEWTNSTKKNTHYTISYTEVRGLVKNWVIRRLKDVMGVVNADRCLREGNLIITLDHNDNSIKSLTLCSTDEYRSAYKDIETIKKVMATIDYKSLKYDPADYLLDGFSPALSINNFDLSSIKNVKF